MKKILLAKIDMIKKYIEHINNKQQNCKICNKTGFINKQINLKFLKTQIQTYCECQFYKNKLKIDWIKEVEKIQDKLLKIDLYIPKEYHNLTCTNKEFENFFKQYDYNFLWICGNTGTGKTALLYWKKINEIINEDMNELNIIREIDFNYESDISGIIAFDDVGIEEKKENRYKYLINYYYDVIDKKRNFFMKCIFTSNLKFQDWLNILGKYDKLNAERIASRMSNETKVIELKGNDRRKHSN